MAQDENENSQTPQYLTADQLDYKLNGALTSQKKEMQKMIQQQQQQFQELLASFNNAFGPKPEAPPLPTKAALAEDTSSMKEQLRILLEERKSMQEQAKNDRLQKTLRESLQKHGINSRSDLALKFLQDQVKYDEDGQLVMNTEITPGVIQPLPIHEAVAKFAQSDHGKFLADPKEVRGSGSRSISAPGSQAQATAAQLITGNSGAPVFKDAKDLKAYVSAEMGKSQLKY